MPLNDFLFSFNAVMPVFLVMLAGFLLRRAALDARTTGRVNWLVFNCALPIMLFRDIAGSDFAAVLDGGLILFAVVSTLMIVFLILIAAPRIVAPEEQGAFIQGAFRGNYAIVGLQIISNIMGSAYSGKASLITTFMIPLYNIMAVFVLTVKSAESYSRANALASIRKAAVNIIKNPLIIGILLGIPFSASHTKLPEFLASGVNSIAGLATPLALLAIGASIDLNQIRNKWKPAATAAIIKLILTPLIFVPIAVIMGFTGERAVILFVMFATPTSVSSYIMAESMGNGSALAANIVLLTTLGSLLTFTGGVFWLRAAGVV